MSRPLYSRADLDQLKTFTRRQILDAFGSFDENTLDESSFILKTAGLLDPNRVPGLANAVAQSDPDAVCRTVMAACTPDASDLPDSISDGDRQLGCVGRAGRTHPTLSQRGHQQFALGQ